MKTIFYPFAALVLVAAVTVLYKTTAAADSGVSSVTGRGFDRDVFGVVPWLIQARFTDLKA